MRWWLQPQSIHGELARFVVVLALPLVALIAYILYDRAQRDIADAEAVVRRLADNGAERAARFAEEARATLEAIAKRPLVRAMDPARCDPDLRHLLELYPRAANFLVVDRAGRILCGAIPPPRDRVVRIKDEALLREVLASGRFAVSQPVVGHINKRWSVAAVQPVSGADGAVAGTVSMSIDLVNWRPFPPVTGLPGDTIVTLLSGNVVIARSSDAETWVGRDVSAGEVMRSVRGMQQGVVRARGVAGADRIWAFRPVPGTNWTVLAGMRAEHVMGPVRARAVNVALVVALLVGAVIALAVVFARRLARPVQRIVEALRERAAGRDEVQIPVSGPREIAAVAEELNRTGRTLRESEARFRALWDASAAAILMLDEASVIRYANPAVLAVFGYRPEELIGQDIALLQPAALAAGHREGIARYMRSGNRRADWRAFQAVGRRKDGAEFPVAISFSELQLDGQRHFAGYIADVTEQARAEQRLEVAQRLFAALSEVNEAIVRVREPDQLYEEVCRICVRRVGLLVAFVSLAAPGRRQVAVQVQAGERADVIRGLRIELDEGGAYAGGVTAQAVRSGRAAVSNDVAADPARRDAQPLRERIGSRACAALPLYRAGEVCGALTVHSAAKDFFDAPVVELLTRMADDISFALDKLAEQGQLAVLTRELEERVRRRTAELQAANEELEAFSYSVSHDLRAPVRHVEGFAQLLEKELKSPTGKAAHYLGTIAAAAKRMGMLIDDLLQLSRTGRLPLALRRVDTGALVRELMHEAAPEIGARQVEWAVGELPAVMADAALLRILLQNLLSNALKYSRARAPARIAIEARAAPGGTVEISVRDNGVGFDPRFKDKLFGVFQRLHREEEFEGTGIGLATARRIAHRHGQRIWGEGMPGQGAMFTFTMALAQEEGADEGGTHTAG